MSLDLIPICHLIQFYVVENFKKFFFFFVKYVDVVFEQTVTLVNNGPSDASNIVVAVRTSVVAGVRAPTFDAGHGNAVSTRDPVYHEWSVPALKSGEQTTLTITYRATTDATVGSTSSLKARVVSLDQHTGKNSQQAAFKTFFVSEDHN